MVVCRLSPLGVNRMNADIKVRSMCSSKVSIFLESLSVLNPQTIEEAFGG
jgi:hypothetical protein